jgi:hypothetical protein
MGRGLATHDIPIVGAGILALISSFLPWFGTTYRTYGYGAVGVLRASTNAWNSGALAWVPIVLMVVAGGLAAAYLFSQGKTAGLGGIGPSAAIAAMSALALLLVVVRWITLPHAVGTYGGYISASTGARAGLILGLIAAAVMTFFAVRRLRASRAGARPPGQYDREQSLAGYSGTGADRGRAMDRERQYAGREGQGQAQRRPAGAPGHPDDRGGYDEGARYGGGATGQGGTPAGYGPGGAGYGTDAGGSEAGAGGYGSAGYGTGPEGAAGAGRPEPGPETDAPGAAERERRWDR